MFSLVFTKNHLIRLDFFFEKGEVVLSFPRSAAPTLLSRLVVRFYLLSLLAIIMVTNSFEMSKFLMVVVVVVAYGATR